MTAILSDRLALFNFLDRIGKSEYRLSQAFSLLYFCELIILATITGQRRIFNFKFSYSKMPNFRFLVFTFSLSLFCGFISVTAQQTDSFHYEIRDHHFRLELDRGIYEISFYSPEIAEVTFFEDYQADYASSHAVVLKQKYSGFDVEDTDSHVALLTEGLQIFIKKPSGWSNPLLTGQVFYFREFTL